MSRHRFGRLEMTLQPQTAGGSCMEQQYGVPHGHWLIVRLTCKTIQAVSPDISHLPLITR